MKLVAFYDYSLYAAILNKVEKNYLHYLQVWFTMTSISIINPQELLFWLKLFIDPTLKATDLENKDYVNVFYGGQHLR